MEDQHLKLTQQDQQPLEAEELTMSQQGSSLASRFETNFDRQYKSGMRDLEFLWLSPRPLGYTRTRTSMIKSAVLRQGPCPNFGTRYFHTTTELNETKEQKHDKLIVRQSRKEPQMPPQHPGRVLESLTPSSSQPLHLTSKWNCRILYLNAK